MMIRIAICDSEKEKILVLEQIIRNWGLDKRYNVIIPYCKSGEDLLLEMELHGQFDMVFMKVEMEGNKNGIGYAADVKKIFPLTEIVFYESNTKYYKEAYAVHPFQFLDDPIIEKDVERTLEEYFLKENMGRKCVRFQYQKIYYSIRIKDICFIEQRNRKLFFHCKDGNIYPAYLKMPDVEMQMKQSDLYFVRTNHAYLVNTGCIKKRNANVLVLHNGTTISISYQYRKKMKEELNLLKL